jgi:hypothetical protein
LVFEANEGQAPAGVQFTAHGPGFGVAVAASGVTLDFPTASVGLHLAGADPAAQAQGLGRLSSTSNYFLGADPSQWHTDVPNYAQVQYQNVYYGIDALYSGADQRQLEYTFVVHAGADPGAIRLDVQGANGLSLDAQGDLVVHTAGGDLTQSAPVLYQDGPGGRQAVAGSFVLQGGDQVGFAVGAYDPTRTLFIDPTLSYSTYLEGSNNDAAYAVAVDGSGNSYVVGQTNSTNFPTTLGVYEPNASGNEAFVTKFNSSGGVAWSTYLGSSFATASGVAVDSSGNVYVVGVAGPNFPTTTGAYQTSFTGSGSGWDSFVTKLNSSGSALSYSTYFGFTNAGVNTAAYGVAVDSSSHAFVTGSTPGAGNGFSFPTTTGAFQTGYGGGSTDAFITEFNSSGSGLAYSSYLGGSGADVAYGIALDSSGDAYLTGGTTSTNLPTTTGAFQTGAPSGTTSAAFVTEVNSSGSSKVYSTYLTGGNDQGKGIALDSSGSAYVTGWTQSSTFPTASPYQSALSGTQDAFVSKLNSSGSALTYSTFLGGSSTDSGNAIAVTSAGAAVVTGSTSSSGFPTREALYSTYGGSGDAFVSELTPAGSGLAYSTFLGGNSADQGNGVGVDGSGNAYAVGVTSSSNFPTTAGAYQTTASGGTNVFVSKIGAPAPTWSGTPTFTWAQAATSPPSVTNPGSQTSAEGASVSLQVSATSPNGYTLSYDAVNLPVGLSISASTGLISGTVDYQAAEDFAGSYPVTVIVSDGHGNSTTQAFTWTVTDVVRAPVLTNPGSQTNAQGDTVSLQINATQPDGDQIIYDATGLPSGLTIDSLSGLISGAIDPNSGALGGPYSVTVTATDQTQTASQTFTWTVTGVNLTPILTSPGNQTNAAGDVVSLALTATDADNDTLTYTATGLPAGLSIDPAAGTISGTIANSAASGTAYSVTVTASDGMTNSSQTFNWTVNYVGVTNPGDQGNVNGDVVSLPITAYDAGGLTLTYSATGLPSGLSINTSTGVISGTLSSTADTGSPYSTTVTASDGTHSASQSFNWAVAHMALANPGDRSDREGAAVSLQLSATDAGGTPTFSATGLPSGVSINSSTGLISGTLGVADHGSSPYQVTVTATDGTKNASQSFVWTVTPRVALVNPGPQANAAGDAVSLAVSASTVGGTLTYSATGLPSGLSINASTGVISGTIGSGAASTTPYSITVTANDGTSSSSQTFLWTVSVVSVPQHGDQTNLDGDAVSLSFAAHYHGTGTLSYSATGLPPGLSINTSTGLVSGTLTNTADAGGPYTVTVTATDGTASGGQTFNWNVDSRIVFNPLGDQTNGVGNAVSLPVVAGDALNGTLTYSASGLPSGLSISSSTGVISGTISVGADTSSPYSATITATVGAVSASQTFNWTVTHVALANPGPQTSADGASVSLAVQGRDTDGDTVTYTAGGLPTGLSISGTTGVISGTVGSSAHTGGPYTVTVTASDGTHSTNQTFLWTVLAVGVTNPGSQTATEGGAVSLQVVASAASGTLTYSAGNLPPGLSINTSTGLISGTVAAGAAAGGPYTVTVASGNGTAVSSQTFTWAVNPRVTVTAVADQANVEGNSVSLQVAASESGATLTYSATNLPTGLSINGSTGLISGTVSSGASHNGLYRVSVTVSDGTYSTGISFTWTVTHSPNTAPTLSNPGTQASVGGDVASLTLAASDADGDPLTFSATGLPHGLYLDPFAGVISGTLAADAVQAAPYSVTVTVNDGNGGVTSQTFNWVVNDGKLTAQGASVSATEGTRFDETTVATFTDADLGRQATDYTATISWGDGSSSTGDVSGAEGVFAVTGGHVYAHPGAFTVGVTVADPAGFTATASGTATVAAASLAVTAGQTSDVLKGAAFTQTLATFTDANASDSAGSYTASINWGDGTAATTGTVSGAQGSFSVNGGHTYASRGTYTVTVTVTDADNTSASATLTETVGDAFAGEATSLTVASFTSTDPSAAVADFTATVAWGDGATSAGTVSGSGGTFSVTGGHTYAQDNTYTAQITVTDRAGRTISTSNSVVVVRAPVGVYNEAVAATAGTGLSNALVGVFTDPNTNDLSTQYTATIDWGDGTTTTTGTVSGSAGLFEVRGGHTYASPGVYQVIARLLWGAANTAVATSSVMALEPATPDTGKIVGPAVVPGNSIYQYTVSIAETPSSQIDTSWTFSVDGVKLSDTKQGHFEIIQDGVVYYTGFWADIDFTNKPAEATVSLSNWLKKGKAEVKDLNVTVVQVRVGDPSKTFGPAFQPGEVVGTNPAFNKPPTTIDGKEVEVPQKNVQAGKDLLDHPGLRWGASVVLRAPDSNTNAWKKINVGFVQQVYYAAQHVTFPTAVLTLNREEGINPYSGMPVIRSAGSTITGQPVYTDTKNNRGPQPQLWMHASGVAFFEGSTEKDEFKELQDIDTPNALYPIVFKQMLATNVSINWYFILNLAATTTDQGGGSGAANKYIREASMNWNFNGSSDLSPNGANDVTWTGKEKQGEKDVQVATIAVLSDKPAKGTWWSLPTGPGGSVALLSSPTSEDALHSVNWVSSKKP